MKVITIKQLWATLIAKTYKEYEFRTIIIKNNKLKFMEINYEI